MNRQPFRALRPGLWPAGTPLEGRYQSRNRFQSSPTAITSFRSFRYSALSSRQLRSAPSPRASPQADNPSASSTTPSPLSPHPTATLGLRISLFLNARQITSPLAAIQNQFPRQRTLSPYPPTSPVLARCRTAALHQHRLPLIGTSIAALQRRLSSTDTTKHSPPAPTKANPQVSAKDHEHGHHLFERIPHLPHRPTKEELLAAATGAWSRFKVRFKWFSIKSSRPFNADDISAFFSWILLGHFVWIIVGTTTFFSLCIWFVNTVFAQETLARWVGNYLTQASGVQVVFESAIVPKWGDGVISFKRVFVSRRPGMGRSKVSKGSQASAVAAAAAAAEKNVELVEEEEDTNYTQFDLSIDTINVTLSFAKWFNSKGLLRDVEVIGIRGVVDRTYVLPAASDVDPASYKHEHNPGDFEIDTFRMEDLLVTVYQPGNFRPFPVSIYSCELPRLRKQWLFYDFLNANTMHGSYDNSLFTIHPRQGQIYTGVPLMDGQVVHGTPGRWRKQNRIRIDGLNIDHLNYGTEGPFSWIRYGNVDVIADFLFPEDDDDTLVKVMSEFYDRVEATVISNGFSTMHPSDDSAMVSQVRSPFVEPRGPVEYPRPTDGNGHEAVPDPEPQVMVEMRMSLNNVRAAVPLFTRDMSYVNNALVRPIVAYINSHRNYIPINCRFGKQLSAFDGSWSMYDSGLMDDLSLKAYDAFVRNITDDDEARRRRFRKVGLWTLQLAAQALFIGLAGHVA